MNKAIKKIVCFLLCASFFIVPCSINISAETTLDQDKQAYKEYQDYLAQLKKQQQQIASDITNAKKEQSSAIYMKSLLDKEIAVMMKQIAATDNLIEFYNERIVLLEKQINETDAKIEKACEALREHLIFMQENEMGDHFSEFLFGSEDLSELLARADMLNDMLEYDRKLIETLDSEKKSIENKKTENENAANLCLQLQKDNESMRAELEKKQKDAAAYIEQIKNNISSYEKLQAEVLASESEVDRQMKELAEQIKDKEQYQNETMIWPVDRTYSRISQFYKGVNHTGIDIPTNWTCVKTYSVASGTVVKAIDDHWSYGNYVVIDHGGGIQTLYAHLSSINVREGTKLKQGDVLGYTGTTGVSTGIHLHFMIYVNGSHVDPLTMIKQPK